MRKIIVLSMMTLDGVIQAPGGPEEDESQDFKYGGWVAPYMDEESGKVMQEEMRQTDYLLGRKTFEIWENYWPQHSDFWPAIGEGMKYVLSTTRKNSDWKNSTFIEDVDAIKKIKQSEGRDIQVWGSSKMIQLLFKHDLVDELRLKIYPITLGKGNNLFGEGVIPAAFKLANSVVTSKGVIMANYERAGKVETGRVGPE